MEDVRKESIEYHMLGHVTLFSVHVIKPAPVSTSVQLYRKGLIVRWVHK